MVDKVASYRLRDLDQRPRRQESWSGAEGKLHRSPLLAMSLSPSQNRWQKQLKGGVYFFFESLEGPTHHDMGRCSGRASTLNGGGSLQNICLPLDGPESREFKPGLGPRPNTQRPASRNSPLPGWSCNLPKEHHQMAPKDSDAGPGGWGWDVS